MFPNPANYYLPVPEQFETEITTLNLKSLKLLHFDLSILLTSDQQADFEMFAMTNEFTKWVQQIKTSELINLIRWTAERLAYLHHKQNLP